MTEVCKSPTVEEIKEFLQNKFDCKIKIDKIEERRVYATLDKSDIFEICRYIRDNLSFEQMTSITGIDLIEKMQVVYHISNYYNGVIIELTADIPLNDLTIDSTESLWKGGNWHEREVFELFGIIFKGHPKLERLLTPENYEFFPFRKSYKLRGQE